jgi:hypothetical protein
MLAYGLKEAQNDLDFDVATLPAAQEVVDILCDETLWNCSVAI